MYPISLSSTPRAFSLKDRVASIKMRQNTDIIAAK